MSDYVNLSEARTCFLFVFNEEQPAAADLHQRLAGPCMADGPDNWAYDPLRNIVLICVSVGSRGCG
jgi:hypothetical protein